MIYAATYKRPVWEWRCLIPADIPVSHDQYVRTREGHKYSWDSRITLKEFSDYFIVKDPEALDPAQLHPTLDLLCVKINTYAKKPLCEWDLCCKGTVPSDIPMPYMIDTVITQQQYLDYVQTGMFVFLEKIIKCQIY